MNDKTAEQVSQPLHDLDHHKQAYKEWISISYAKEQKWEKRGYSWKRVDLTESWAKGTHWEY